MHSESHPLAGKTVVLESKGDPTREIVVPGATYHIEDWWDSEYIGGGSWMNAVGNPACLQYALRGGLVNLPIDNEVVYGKIDDFGHLVHVSELGEVLD